MNRQNLTTVRFAVTVAAQRGSELEIQFQNWETELYVATGIGRDAAQHLCNRVLLSARSQTAPSLLIIQDALDELMGMAMRGQTYLEMLIWTNVVLKISYQERLYIRQASEAFGATFPVDTALLILPSDDSPLNS